MNQAADKIVRVDMTALKVTQEPVPAEWAGLGGRALTSTIVALEVPPTCHPLGPNNKLVFAPGLLTGTRLAQSGRLSAGGKSPLTGTIKESNAGGTSGQLLARLGIRALIIEGLPPGDGFFSLHLSHSGGSIRPESELVGRGNFEVIETVRQREGAKVGVMTLGVAGEMKLLSANISTADTQGGIRSFGRGGLGAVLGSKRIKFICIDAEGATGVSLADPDRFAALAREFSATLIADPLTGGALPAYGTAVLVNAINEAGAFPTKNYRFGQFEGHERISGETLNETIVKRGGAFKHSCHPGCVIQCSQLYPDREGRPVTSGLEYETIWALGANALIGELDPIARADRLMDDLGLDSIETSVTMAVAMEVGLIPWGDAEGVLGLLEQIGRGTPLGRMLGCGATTLGRVYGTTRVPAVKGQSLPAYDPRSLKGMGITYATSTMGADHTAGNTLEGNLFAGTVPPHGKKGQVELSRGAQLGSAALDSTGLCLFVVLAAMQHPELLGQVVELVDARTGAALTPDFFGEMGARILKTERDFNERAGFTSAHDRLPEFFGEPLPPHQTTWDFTGDEIDLFWNF